MFGQHFYHQRIRKSVAIFGSMFNNINVVRKGSGTASINQVKVPLSYAPKRDFIDRIAQMDLGEDNERQLAIKLPRMSFEIVSIDYDNVFQLPKTQRLQCGTGANRQQKLFTRTPYIVGFELNVYAKTQDDALQIVEQILPYFAPQYNVTIYPLDEVTDLKEDVPITMQSVSFTDDYDGPLEQRRTIIYTLTFEMKIGFYGPIADTPIIRETQGTLFQQGAGLNDSDVILEKIQTNPTPPGVGPDSDFGFSETYYSALDSAPW